VWGRYRQASPWVDDANGLFAIRGAIWWWRARRDGPPVVQVTCGLTDFARTYDKVFPSDVTDVAAGATGDGNANTWLAPARRHPEQGLGGTTGRRPWATNDQPQRGSA